MLANLRWCMWLAGGGRRSWRGGRFNVPLPCLKISTYFPYGSLPPPPPNPGADVPWVLDLVMERLPVSWDLDEEKYMVGWPGHGGGGTPGSCVLLKHQYCPGLPTLTHVPRWKPIILILGHIGTMGITIPLIGGSAWERGILVEGWQGWLATSGGVRVMSLRRCWRVHGRLIVGL
jgi:hypothetical protein